MASIADAPVTKPPVSGGCPVASATASANAFTKGSGSSPNTDTKVV